MFRFSPRPNRAHLVKWRPWGAEAFQEAQQQDKPLVLWLTAFWCGSCQRMDDTTLSNDAVIALLNACFVPMRVEESQRPDVDLRYNQNGWPTIAFLTPAGDDMLRVNSLDPEPFIRLLVRLVDAYQRDKATLLETAARNRLAAQQRKADMVPAPLGASIVAEITGMLEGLADRVHGGYGTQAKCLHTDANDFLLYLFGVSGDRSYLDHVAFTLEQMRDSRTFDHKAGGFFRYSSRADWREPHPEKLLDDQAGLGRNYLCSRASTAHSGTACARHMRLYRVSGAGSKNGTKHAAGRRNVEGRLRRKCHAFICPLAPSRRLGSAFGGVSRCCHKSAPQSRVVSLCRLSARV